VGDELEVKVLKFDPVSHRIALGRKQLLRHPWEGIEERCPVGSFVRGKVTGLADFGAFVEIEPGVEGLIHVSELSWTERPKHAQEAVKVGQEVDVRIIAIDRDKEKISLSVKRAGPSPWEQARQLFPANSVIEGEISHLAAFGAFVRIPLGIEGLIKNQDISWTDRAASAKKTFKVNDKVKAVVLEIDAEKEKMSLGVKQLTPDPLKVLKIGQAVTGRVEKSGEFGVVLKLESGLEALIRPNERQLNRSIFAESDNHASPRSAEPSVPQVGDTVTAVVTKIEKKERRIELSIRRYEKEQEKSLLRKYSGSGGTYTIGETTGWGKEEKETP
jgi:small subunit ribosomal protein S1